MLTLKHLSKSYVAGTPVLQDVNLEVAARGITAIIGASGTGKSTLIRCINRLVEPTSGAILFENQDLARLSGQALRDAWPIVATPTAIIWVAGMRAAAGYLATPESQNIVKLRIARET